MFPTTTANPKHAHWPQTWAQMKCRIKYGLQSKWLGYVGIGEILICTKFDPKGVLVMDLDRMVHW